VYRFHLDVMVKPSFLILGRPFIFGCDHPNAKIPMDAALTAVPRGIYYSSQYFVLKFLQTLEELLALWLHP
jgi:hypothetical protein